MYVTDEEVDDLNKNTNFETFWLAVEDGTWPRYEVLWRFALALGTKYIFKYQIFYLWSGGHYY